ncbi:hypothetical protein AVEN_106694-1 [Araneus ventricosus]|uniref:Uncharacterized protein n=1 Tax=Araneus ventricosus TaxID=182803 RepID=A0A4Y2EJF5_ARAVE|nr:hypothetical protein AVEN_106694-1 [Araneus ventricosus]
MACVQSEKSDLRESDLDDTKDQYSLDISESDFSEFEFSAETDSDSDSKLTFFDPLTQDKLSLEDAKGLVNRQISETDIYIRVKLHTSSLLEKRQK